MDTQFMGYHKALASPVTIMAQKQDVVIPLVYFALTLYEG